MTISKQDAIAAARQFWVARGHHPWDEASIEVHPDVIEGRHAWVVEALYALPPGYEDWMRPMSEQPVRYYVDPWTAVLFGIAAGYSTTIFTKKDSARNAMISARNAALRRGEAPPDLPEPVAGSPGIGPQDAIDSARRFCDSRRYPAWDETSIDVYADVIEDRHVWVVEAQEALAPGQEEWMRGFDEHASRYFVDACSGEFIAIGDDDLIRHIGQRKDRR